jgi:aspartyl-tRNA(Asn)/glutamyl-tRNA(Gln) amidotransferase subunit A
VSGAETARGLAERLDHAKGLNAVLSWSKESLDAEAARIDAMPKPGALAAVPVAIKDNIVTLDHPTTCGSRILEGYRSPFESTATRRLREAGAMIACKANMDEFAMGSSTEHSAFGRVLHPLSPGAFPGFLGWLGRAGRGGRRAPRHWAPKPAARSGSRRRSAASWA